VGEGLPGLHPHANFFRCGFKNVGLEPPKSQKLVIFVYIFGHKRYILLSNFYKIWRGEGLLGPHSRANFHCVALKMWPYGRPPKSPKNNFWYKFAPKKKSRGSIEKLDYRCTTRNLPLCNGTIIVLKITLLHDGVSVITNFVFPKHDIKKQNKKITLFRLQPAREPRSPPYLAW